MDVLWLLPTAWFGLLALALPVLVHLLSRQTRRQVLFPSLRFLRPTPLAAVRRRALQDWPLLAVRLLILATTVAALATPVFVSAARQAEWSTRVARAFVVAPGNAGFETMLQEERQDSFTSAVFTPGARVSDGIREATTWLAQQPPAAQEVVIVGDLRAGAVSEDDLSQVWLDAGIRFLVVPNVSADRGVEIPSLGGADRRLDGLPVAVHAAPGDQAFANLALRAVLARGVALDRARARRVLVIFDGAETRDLRVEQPATAAWMREALEQLPDLSGGESGGSLVVYAEQRAQGAAVPALIDRALRAALAEDLRNVEPRRVSPAAVASWSRPPGVRSQVSGIRHEGHEGRMGLTDEGDRRWLWGGVLLLLGVEALIRKSTAAPSDAVPDEEEQPRVA